MPYEDYAHWRTSPVSEPELSVVVPTYNEADRLLPTLAAMALHVSELGLPWELIIADSGSTDGTPELATQLGFVNLTVLRAESRDGKGAGVARGMLAARGDLILFADADGSTPISILPEFVEAIEYSDVVIASRSQHAASRSTLRRLLSAGLHWLVRSVLRLGVDDSQCGFKLFRRSVARRVFATQTIRGFSFDLEALYLARKRGARIAEVPVDWVDAPGSTVDPLREVLRFLRDMLAIRRNDLQGVYGNG